MDARNEGLIELDIAAKAIELLRPDIELKKNDSGFTCRCPLHNDSKPSFSCYISQNDGRLNWHCFAEDIGGHLISLVVALLRQEKGYACNFEAYEWLLANNLVTKDYLANSTYEQDYYLGLFLRNSNAALRNDTRARAVRQYLENRGITKDLLPKFPIGFYTNPKECSEWCEELHVPQDIAEGFLLPTGKAKVDSFLICFEFNVYGEVAALQVRDVANELLGAPKKRFYLGSADKAQIRYFGNQRCLTAEREVVLVEGQFDAMALTKFEYQGNQTFDIDDYGHSAKVVAVHGTSGFNSLTKCLLEKGVKVTMFPDMDAAGLDVMDRIITSYPEVKVMLPDEMGEEVGIKDPFDYVNQFGDEVFRLFDNRIAGWRYKYNQFVDAYEGADDEDAQLTVIRNAISFAKKLSGISLSKFVYEWAEEVEADKDVIMQEVKSSGKYRIDKDPITFGTYAKHITKEGLEIWEPVSPVVCKLLPGEILDTGLTKEANIKLQVEIANLAPQTLSLSAADYANDQSLNTAIIKALGANAFTNPKNMLALREASKEIQEEGVIRTVQQYTGWSPDFKSFYMPGSVVTKVGISADSDIAVDLGSNPAFLTKYGFCVNYTEADIEEAKRTLRDYALNIFPREIMLMLITAMFSPLVYPFINAAKSTVVWLSSSTGHLKTSTIMSLMNLYGNFDGEEGNHDTWGSTETAITITGYKLKNVPYLVDDYKQNSVPSQKVTRIIQGAADGNARSRSNRSLTLNGVYNIRGLMISTGEQSPDFGEASVSGRLLLLPIYQRANTEMLTYVQRHNAKLSCVTVEFIKYLIAKEIDSQALRDEFLELRQQSQTGRGHARTAETAAAMTVVWRYVSEFLGWTDLDAEFHDALSKVVAKINIACERESVATLFVDILAGVIADNTLNMCNLESNNMYGLCTDGKTVGYYDNDYEYIHPDKAIAEVNKRLRDMNHPLLNFSREALYAQLSGSGTTEIDAKGNNPKFPAKTGISTQRCLKFKRGTFVGKDSSDTVYTQECNKGISPLELPVEAVIPF